jgi:hypothetical protein
MASFTESATLEVKDRSTAQIKKINAELKRLQATAASLRSIRIEITGVALARRQIQGLLRDMRALRAVTANIKVNLTGGAAARSTINSLQRQITALRASAARPIAVTVAGGRGGRGGGIPPVVPPGVVQPVPPRTPGRRTGGRSMAGAALMGANLGGGLGLGMLGLGSLNPAFLAVATAAYAAAAALHKIGTETVKASRADLLMKIGATPEQQTIINKALEKYVAGTHPLAMSNADMKMFITGMLGDVGGKTATERATAAANVAPQIADIFLPLAYGLGGPSMTKERAMEGLNTLVKGLNIASGNLTNSLGQLTEDGRRVVQGVALAKAMNPLLEPTRIRTTLANLKDAVYSMNPESLAALLASAGDRGVRAGHEYYMAQRAMTGVVDNKALNKALLGLGLLEIDPKDIKKGVPLPGKGTPVDADLLRKDFFGWVEKHIWPKLEKLGEESLTPAEKRERDERVKKVTEEGGTQEEIDEAKLAPRARLQTILNQMLPGMTATGRTAYSDIIFGMIQRKSALEQARDVRSQDMQKIFDESLSAQLTDLGTVLETKAQQFGTAVADAIGLTEKIRTLKEAIKQPGPERDKALQAGLGFMADLSPIAVGGTLLIKGALLLLQAATKIWSMLPGTGESDKPYTGDYEAPDTQTNLAREALKKVIAEEERRIAEREAFRDRQVAPGIKERADRDILISRAKIEAAKAELAKLPADRLPAGILQPEIKPPAGPDPWAGAKVPTPTDLQSMLDKVGLSTVTFSEIVLKGPSEFERVFNVLPEKSGTAGTSLGTSAIDAINGGASSAGSSMGNSFLDVVRGGLAGLNLNVTATVAGQSGSGASQPDTGARKAD